jgi:hypothetical protein
MSVIKLHVSKRRVRLARCPIGLFMHGDTLCLKTEYGSNEGRIDAYIVSSGEFYWGDAPQTIENQRKQLVRPVRAELEKDR